MRNWIDLIENTGWVGDDDHPHRAGEDEWFSHGFGLYHTNVDCLKRKIASGVIVPREVSYPIRTIVERLFPDFDQSEFGSRDFQDDDSSIDLMGPPVRRRRMANIPQEKLDEPILFVLWDDEDAMRLAGLKNTGEAGKERPQIIDGNHRLIRRYLEGDEGNARCFFVSYLDALSCSTTRGQNMDVIKKQREKRRKPRNPNPNGA